MSKGNRGEATGGSAEGEFFQGSTTWEWKRVKIARPPEASKPSGPKGLHSWRRLPPWPIRRKPLTVTIKYRGGPEAYYEVHSRGRSARFSGGIALHDLMRAIAGHE